MKNTILFIALLLPFYSNTSFAGYPIPEFELVVIESIPETVHLDMTLKQIEEAKQESKIQRNKNLIYRVLTERMSPLLNRRSFKIGYNLLELVTQIPVQDIVNDLITQQESNTLTRAADFAALILPKTPNSRIVNQELPYSSLYSQNKASVIDSKDFGFDADRSISGLINSRIKSAIQFTYKRQYVDLGENQAFFVGALVHFHLAGEQTQMKVQVIGGLPTDQNYPISIIQPEAEFTKFKFPSTPKLKLFSDQFTDHPGVVFSINYQKNGDSPIALKAHFGSLSLIEEDEFKPSQTPQPYNDLKIGWKNLVGVILKRYNVPHLYGTKFASQIGGLINDKTRNIKLNIHEIEFNLLKLEVSDARVTVDFPPKLFFTPLGLRRTHNLVPTIEQPGLNEEVRGGINAKLTPYKQEAESILKQLQDNGIISSLRSSENQAKLKDIIKKLMDNHPGEVQ